MTYLYAAECNNQLTNIGWPGVVLSGLGLAAVVAVVWLVSR